MAAELSPADAAKKAAADRAAGFVENGMRVGLGTGSTAAFLVRRLGQRVRDEGLRIIGVPTSRATGALAAEVGIPVTTLNEVGRLDLTIDGTDEFDAALSLIKGGGAAHLREKIVAAASERLIVISDPDKRVARLGAFPLPVEVFEFGLVPTEAHIVRALADLGYGPKRITRRMKGGEPVLTDEGNAILDLHLGQITDAPALLSRLTSIAGVVETGLFINMCQLAIVGYPDGRTDLVTAR